MIWYFKSNQKQNNRNRKEIKERERRKLPGAHLPGPARPSPSPLPLSSSSSPEGPRRGARPRAPATSCFALEAALRPNSRHDDAPCPLSLFPHSLHPLSLLCLSPSLIPGRTETADEHHRSHQHPHAQPVRPRAPPWIREALPRRTRRRVP